MDSVGQAARHAELAKVVKRQVCNAYLAPAANTKIEPFKDVALQWDPACFTADTLRIFAYPGPSKAWTASTFSGQTIVQFDPRWFNRTTAGNVDIQLQMTGSKEETWMSSVGRGPTFQLVFDGAFPEAKLDAAADPGLSQEPPKKETGLAGGALASAVVVPVLTLLAVIVAYVVWSRKRSKSDTRRWSNYVDNRLSMVSQGPNASFGTPRASTMHFPRDSTATFPSPPSMARTGHERKPSAISFQLPPNVRAGQDDARELDTRTIKRIAAPRPESSNVGDHPAMLGESSVAILRGDDRLSRLESGSAVSGSTRPRESIYPSLYAVEDEETGSGAEWYGDEDEEEEVAAAAHHPHGDMPRFGRDSMGPDGALAEYAASRSSSMRSNVKMGGQPGALVFAPPVGARGR